MKKSKKLMPALAMTAVVAGLVFSCSKKSDNSTPVAPSGGDAVLVNLGENIVIPAYTDLAAKLTTLEGATTAFNAAPSSQGLSQVRTAFTASYLSWAGASEFEFGPATDKFLTTHFVNSFPTDTAIIRGNISGNAYAIDGIGNFAAQGFPAIDYLLNAGTDAAALARFSTDAAAKGARDYLAALVHSLKTKTDDVVTAWSAGGGNYLGTFEAATGVDAGSSLSLFVNAFVQDFDVNLQNFKLGIPIGIYGPTTLPKSPAKVEGFYGNLSNQLLLAQVTAYQKIYAGGSGHGLEEKLRLTGVQESGELLSQAVTAQLATLRTKIGALPDPLSAGITAGDTRIAAAFTEVRKTTVLLKSDMPSALGIKISFADDDGD